MPVGAEGKCRMPVQKTSQRERRPYRLPCATCHACPRQVVRAERGLGFFCEQRIQQLALRSVATVRVLNVYYWAAHMFSTIGTLLLVFCFHPDMYQVLPLPARVPAPPHAPVLAAVGDLVRL